MWQPSCGCFRVCVFGEIGVDGRWCSYFGCVLVVSWWLIGASVRVLSQECVSAMVGICVGVYRSVAVG